jgi:trimeric autotransporter adhesin
MKIICVFNKFFRMEFWGKKSFLILVILSVIAFSSCIDTYIENSGDGDDDDETTSVNSEDFSYSSIDAMAENCATHETASDYVWENSSVVTIALNGKSATVDGTGATADGNIVTITSGGNYSISGSFTDGQIIVNTEDTAVVRLILNSVEINCSTGIPLNVVKSEKTIIVLADNSSNTITDKSTVASSDTTSSNAAIYCTGNVTICGNGKLTAVSDKNDGIATTAGLIISTANINVSAADDGIRGKDYLLIKSGTITVDAGGDGLRSNNESDNTKGYVAIVSGTIGITSEGDGISAQTDAIIVDGKIDITSGGDDSSASSKGIKGLVNVIVDDGTITLKCTNNAIHSAGNVAINNGTIAINTSQSGADGINTNSTLTVAGGTLGITIAGDATKAIKTSGTMTLSGGDIDITTSGNVTLESSGSGNKASYCTALKSDENIVVSGSNITIVSSGKGGKGVSTDGNFTMTSGSLDIKTTGAGATYTNESGTADSYNATCITTDGTASIIGGTVTLSSSGSAGKGITSTGALTIGDESNSPTINVTTSGSKITVSGSSSGGGGGFGGGGSSSSANYSLAKAIKSDAAITINNGTITISSADDGIKSEKSITVNNGSVSITKSTEGMESPLITVNGGYVSLVASDDGFNATAGLTAGGTESNDGSMLTINGGTVLVSTTAGDGIDSNGSVAITGGTIVVQGPSSSPELGLDVNGTCSVSGGLLIASGPNSGNMIEGPSTSSDQYSIMATSSSIGTNLFHVQDASGNEIVTFKPVRSAYYVVFSSPNLDKGSSYSIYTGGSSTGTSTGGLYTGGTYTAGTQKKTFSVSSKLTAVSF